jgi:diguanylate cyclase (GGDEF)-like protein
MSKYFIFLLILFPSITEYLESGHFPDTSRDYITDVVMTIVTAIIVVMYLRRNQFIENLSLTDPLTGIGNRRQFDLDIQKAISRSKRTNSGIGLIFFDLDRFKEINDEYGHKAGDNVLIEFADKLTKFSRKGTDSCYRFGGDEFAVILTDICDEDVDTISNMIDERLENIVYTDLSYGLSASKGVVFYNRDESHQQFLKRADEAMYQAKGSKWRNTDDHNNTIKQTLSDTGKSV